MSIKMSWIGRKLIRSAVLVSLPLFWSSGLLATDGHFMHGAGPVNEAMGGADTGVCLDATGSVAWNPACSVRFSGKVLDFYGIFFVPWRDLSSTVNAGAFGPGIPPVTLQGTTVSHRDSSVMPGLSFIYHPKDSRNAYHFAMLAVSGFGVNYPGNTNFSNPILTPQAPNGFGFGKIQSNYALLEVPMGVSRTVTSKLSVGVSVVPAFSMLKVIPAPFAAPVTAGSIMPYYLSASKNSTSLGIGYEAGLQYEINPVVSVGLAYHSPIWFQEFKWKSPDLTGAVHNLTFQMNLPQLVTTGVGIKPAKGTRIGLDARWINYADTSGFDEAGYDPDDAVAGFGWNNIWVVGGGVEQQVTSSTKAIVGYNYSQNPIPSKYSFFNTPAPAIVQQHVSFGVVQSLNSAWNLNLTYYHAFQNSLTGPWVSPRGPIPGTSVTSRMSENSFTVGLTRSF
jgi:long-chain fatty acid transport protein